MRLPPKRLALILAIALPTAFATTAAGAHGCGRHGGPHDGDALRHLAFNRALLGGRPDCVDKVSIEERRARHAARGGFFEIHGRYQH